MFDKKVIRFVVPVSRERMCLQGVLPRVVLVSSSKCGVIDVFLRSKVTVGRASVRDRVSPVLSPSTSQKDAKVAYHFFWEHDLLHGCQRCSATTMQLYSAWGAGLRAVGHRMCGSVRLLSQPCSSSKTLPSLWLINKKSSRSGLSLQSFTRRLERASGALRIAELDSLPLTARRRGHVASHI